jgi:hypothetical protein
MNEGTTFVAQDQEPARQARLCVSGSAGDAEAEAAAPAQADVQGD